MNAVIAPALQGIIHSAELYSLEGAKLGVSKYLFYVFETILSQRLRLSSATLSGILTGSWIKMEQLGLKAEPKWVANFHPYRFGGRG